MDTTFHVDHTTIDPFLARVFRAAFPGYSGRKFKIESLTPDADGVARMNLRSYWDGGSRDQYVLIRLADLSRVAIPTCHPVYDPQIRSIDEAPIPPGVVVVRHSIFCGKDMGLTVHVAPADRHPSMLPVTVNLSNDERFVLTTIAGLKSFARDEARARYRMPRAVYDAAKSSLVARKLLNTAGAITPAGRNAIGSAIGRRDYYGETWTATPAVVVEAPGAPVVVDDLLGARPAVPGQCAHPEASRAMDVEPTNVVVWCRACGACLQA